MEKFTYYKIGNRKYSLERIDDNFYEVIVFINDDFIGSYCFEGETAHADALRKILHDCEITEEGYNEE